MAIEAEALLARLEERIARTLFARGRKEGGIDPETWEAAGAEMQSWLLGHARAIVTNDVLPALAEDTARAAEDMRERAAKVCDDRAQLCESAARQWMEGEHPEPEIASIIMAGADQCEQAASEIRALPLDKEAADANR